MTKTKTTDQPSKATLARRRIAAKHRAEIMRTGRRIDLKLQAEAAAALARIESATGEAPTRIISRLLIDAVRHA